MHPELFVSRERVCDEAGVNHWFFQAPPDGWTAYGLASLVPDRCRFLVWQPGTSMDDLGEFDRDGAEAMAAAAIDEGCGVRLYGAGSSRCLLIEDGGPLPGR